MISVDQAAGPSNSTHPTGPDSLATFQRQVTWLTQCVFVLQEQNNLLHTQLSELHNSCYKIMGDMPKKGSAGSGFSRDEPLASGGGGGSCPAVFSNNNLVRKQSGTSDSGQPSACAGKCVNRMTYFVPKRARAPQKWKITYPSHWSAEDIETAKRYGNRPVLTSKGKPLDPKIVGIYPKNEAEDAKSSAKSSVATSPAKEPADKGSGVGKEAPAKECAKETSGKTSVVADKSPTKESSEKGPGVDKEASAKESAAPEKSTANEPPGKGSCSNGPECGPGSAKKPGETASPVSSEPKAAAK